MHGIELSHFFSLSFPSQPVAQRMGLDTKSYTSLWKDLALVELNVAVMYSFQVCLCAIFKQ